MNEEKTIKAVNMLLLIASALIVHSLSYYVAEEHSSASKDGHASKLETIKEEPEKKSVPETLIRAFDLRSSFESIGINYTTLETEYIGVYFITAYCPEECGGSWMTSSGATCHYSDNWSEPTTCAIDRNYHRFGEYLAIDFGDGDLKTYVTEDTGPGVRGLWIDCFVVSMDEVRAWPTGWKPVYQVTYVTHTLNKNERMENHERYNDYLHYCGFDPRLHYRDGRGVIG